MKNPKNNSIWISEIFYSIQGEGSRAGTPAIFVRTGKCNLHCTWCDTKYTWHPNFADYTKWDIKDVIKEIKKHQCKNLVVTGGEPMLQQREIEKLREYFPNYFFEIETNGSVTNIMKPKTIDQFNISPKLSNSGNEKYALRLREPNAIYKFVIQKPEDVTEVEQFMTENKLPQDKIWLMPEGITKAVIKQRTVWLQKTCDKKGWHFTTRLHILQNIR